MVETTSYHKKFLTMLSGNTVSQLIPFLFAPVLTRLYAPEEFAVFVNFLAISSTLGIVAAGRLEQAIPVSKDQDDAQNIAFTGIVLTFILVSLSFIFPAFAEFFARMYQSAELADFLIITPLAVMSYGFLGIVNNWMLLKKKFSILSGGKIAQSSFNNGLAALLGYIGWGVSGLICAWLISQVAGIMVPVLLARTKFSIKGRGLTTIRNTLKDYRDFPLINSLHAFTDIFATQFLLFWIISGYFGLAELGLFAMMHKYVRTPITLITGSVASIFYAEMGTSLNSGESPIPILKKTIITSSLFSIPFFVVMLFFAPQLFGWYFGAEWYVAGQYAQRILPVLIFHFILSPVSSIPILLNEQRKAFFFSTLGHVLTLGSLIVATFLEWQFIEALTLYGVVFATFQVGYLYWFYLLIKTRHARTC